MTSASGCADGSFARLRMTVENVLWWHHPYRLRRCSGSQDDGSVRLVFGFGPRVSGNALSSSHGHSIEQLLKLRTRPGIVRPGQQTFQSS